MASSPALARAWLSPREIAIVTRNAIQAFSVHRTGRMAAALAYYTLFSLFPLLLLLLALLGYVLDAGWTVALGARDYLIEITTETLPGVSELVNSAIASVQQARGTSGLIGVLGLLWAASSTFNQLHIALDQVWGINGLPAFRLTVKRRAISIGIVLGLGLLLLVVQTIKSVTYWLAILTDQLPGGGVAAGLVTWIFPIVAASFVFGLIYRTFPSVAISWRDVWPGAVLAGIGWELLKGLFALYAARFANWQAVYGPVAGVIGLLTWLYLSFTVILFGAEYAAAHATQLRIWPVVPETESSTPLDAASAALAEGAREPSPVAGPEQAPKRQPGFLSGTAAGAIGVLAAVGIGVGLLVGGARRLGRASLPK